MLNLARFYLAWELAPEALGAARLARDKSILPWVLVPMLFNLLLFGTLYYLAGSSLSAWISSWGALSFTGFWAFLEPVVDFLIGAAVLLLWILLLALFASVFAIAVQLVAAPFMGLLAERWFFFAQANHPQNLYYQTVA